MRHHRPICAGIVVAVGLLFAVGSALAAKRKTAPDPVRSATLESVLQAKAEAIGQSLSSSQIIFTPRPAGAMIDVDTAVLAPSVAANSKKARGFAQRHIAAFLSLLADDLSAGAPDLAARFDPNRDIAFFVTAGSARTPVGVWSGGGWTGRSGGDAIAAVAPKAPPPVSAPASAPASSSNEDDKGCDCPARR